MKVEQVKLNNFRGFGELGFQFSEGLNLFVGVNGSGKTTVLDSMAISLSWLVNRIQRAGASGSHISDLSIRNDKSSGCIDMYVDEQGVVYRWFLTKAAKGRGTKKKSSLEAASSLAEVFRQRYEKGIPLPIVVYYPIDRAVGKVVPDVQGKDSIHVLDIYENALEGKANYQSFFEWFRLQDDILNEQAQSRTYWMVRNSPWVKKRVKKILALLDNSIQKEHGYYDRKTFEYLVGRLLKDGPIYQEPRFLFVELAELVHIPRSLYYKNSGVGLVLEHLEYMFQKMGSLGRDFRDDLVGSGGVHQKIVTQISEKFMETVRLEAPVEIVDFLWECFCFAALLSLWWLSSKSKRDVEKLFSKSRSLLEARQGFFTLAGSLPGDLTHIIEKDIRIKRYTQRNEGRELQIVREAVEGFMPGYRNLQVRRVPRPHMVLEKNDQAFSLDQLSDGEKNLIALVGDIARRLAIANAGQENPLAGEGVVMIDEIDLHLHPGWQRTIIPKLLDVFPNCQYFISTHSPQVISSVRPGDIFLLTCIDQEIVLKKPDESYGMSIDRVVELVMDDYPRPESTSEELMRLFEFIERGKIEEAKGIVCSMKEYMPTDPDLLRAEMLIRMGERGR